MGVEVGELYLALTAPGAAEAIADLKKVDAAAKATGKTFSDAMGAAEKATQKATTSVSKLTEAERAHLKAVMAAHEAEMRARAELARAQTRAEAERAAAARKAHADEQQAIRDLQAKEREINRAANAARRAGTPINQGVAAARAARTSAPATSGSAFDAIGLGAQSRAVQAELAGAANVPAAASGFSSITPVLVAYSLALGAVTNRLLAYAQLADDARAQTNRLRGAAIDTGESFEVMTKRADAARAAYQFSREEAGQLISATARLEAETQGAARAQDVLAAAMNTARARGLLNAEAVALIESAIKGNAEAIRELTGLKPDDLYEKWAGKSGITAKSLNDVGKQQALANGMIEEGARRATDAASAIDELTAAQLRQASAQSELKIAIGNALTPMRTWFANVTADALRNLLALRQWAESVDAAIDRIGKKLPTAAATPGKPINPVSVSPLLQYVGGTSFETFKPKKAKEEKDTTDQLIASLVTLLEARQADASQIMRSNALYEREKKLLNDTSQTLERRAKAYERMQQLEKAGVIAIDRKEIVPIKESLPPLDNTAPEFAKPIEVDDAVTTFDDAYAAYIGRIAGIVSQGDFSRIVGKAFSDQTTLAFRAIMSADLQSVAQDFAMLTRNFASVLIDGIAAGFTQGWGSAKDVILGGLGTILQAMGKHLMIAGGGLKALLPFLTNPFTAGGAMVAAGALIFGAGVALSAIATSGGGRGASSSFTGGTTGGLSIGGSATAPQIYTFGAGSRASTGMASGQRAVSSEPLIVQFNGPIIGPNDLQAQQAIASVVKNAARRGLL